jgi:hypothetical protein
MLRAPILLFCIINLLLPLHAQARPSTSRPCEPARAGELFKVDFDRVTLKTVARLVSCAASLDLLFSPPELATTEVSMVAPRPVELAGLMAIFRRVVEKAGLRWEQRSAYVLISRVERSSP